MPSAPTPTLEYTVATQRKGESMNEKTPLNHLITRRAMLAGSAAVAASALAACKKNDAEQGADGASAAGGTLSYHIESPTGIEPYTLEDENAVAVAFNLFDALTYYDYKTGDLVDLVAESHSHNDTDDVWTFKIRKGTKFHDGSEVTAKSFKYAWERLCSPNTADQPSNVSYHLAMVKGYEDVVAGTTNDLAGVTCPDDYTLQVELSAPYADFDYVCAAPVLSPIPEGLGAGDGYKDFSLAPVGNGPFKMKGQWVDGQYVGTERFDDYTNGDVAKLDGVHFAIYRDSYTAYKELDAGSLDCSLVPITATKDAESSYGTSEDGYTATPGKQFLDGTMLYTQFLAFNVNDPLTKDPRVRQALSLAINRQAICDAIYEGSAKPADDILPEAIEGHAEGAWKYAAYDPEQAGKLLDEAGYPAGADGKRNISFKFMTNAANAQDEYQSMQSDWAELGIDVEIDKVEYAAMYQSYLDGTYTVGARAWYADYPIADNYLYPMFYSGRDDNVSHFSDPTYDAMIDKARSVADHDERVKAMQECDAYVAELMPYAPLNYRALARCASTNVETLTVTPGILPLLDEAELKG